ncbi:MAG: hypothetical protein PF517_17090 [Salinivirgaceae bacterium]|jgi:putative transposase|nr:hypothetical protein [Salinivirgaceae bacterium]
MPKITHSEYRRNLPHIQPQGGMFFITFRLYGSIPVSELEKLSEIYGNTNNNDTSGNSVKGLKQDKQENYFQALDDYLDSNLNSPYHLSIPNIDKLVSDSIKYRDGKDYKLVCFCIMSNHVHMIIYKLEKSLDKILKELKSYTGKEALKIIREGKIEVLPHKKNIKGISETRFWQPESFDRIVRDRNDMAKKIAYTLNNPVKANLVSKWQDWKWNYCRPEFLDL